MEEEIKVKIKESIEAKDASLKLTPDIAKAAKAILDTYNAQGKLLICGNGGSAADAQHIAAEFVGKFMLEREALPAIALHCNTSSLTALGNDYGFDSVFRKQVEAFGEKGDILLVISTSGNSTNLLEAVKAAKKIGMKTIGLLGCKGGKLAPLVDIGLIVPSDSTPRIQEVHIMIGHILAGLVEKELFGNG